MGERREGFVRFADINALSEEVIGAAIEVHRALGPGVLEKPCKLCLDSELRHRGLRVRMEVAVPLVYRDVRIERGYWIDLLVEDVLIVEVKRVEALAPVHVSQVLTYLRLARLQVGLLLNFNVKTLRQGGIKRVIRGNAPRYERPRHLRDPG